MKETAIITGASKYQKLFDPRVKPAAGFANFIKEGADVVKNFVSGKFAAEKISEFANIAAGEAKPVKYEDHKTAMYTDEAHHIHAVNASYTHIQCTVSREQCIAVMGLSLAGRTL